jgi:hypothetical protein
MKKILALVAAAAAIFSCAPKMLSGSSPCETPGERVNVVDLPRDRFKGSISIIDEPSEALAELSTPKDYKSPHHSFLRAFIDKASGDVSFQVFNWIVYEGSWRYYTSVSYEAADGLRLEDLIVIDRNIYCA